MFLQHEPESRFFKGYKKIFKLSEQFKVTALRKIKSTGVIAEIKRKKMLQRRKKITDTILHKS